MKSCSWTFLQRSILAIGLTLIVHETFADDLSETGPQPPQARRVRRTAEEILSSPEFQNFERLRRGSSRRQSIGSGSGRTRLRMRTGSGGSQSDSSSGPQNSDTRQRLPGPGQNAPREFGGNEQPGENRGPNEQQGTDPFGGNTPDGQNPGELGNNIGENLGRNDFPEIDDNIPNPADRNFGQDNQPGENANDNQPGNAGGPGDEDDPLGGENNTEPNDGLDNNADNRNGNPAGPGNNGDNQNPNGGENGANQNPAGDNNPRENNEPLPPVRQNNPPAENPPPSEPINEPDEDEQELASQSPASSSFAGFVAGLFHLLAYAILGVVIGLILWLIIKAIKDFELPTKLDHEHETGGDLPSNANEPENAPGEHPPDVYIAKARELAAIGNYRDAIAQLTMGAMSRIERTNRIRYRRGLTIRDYLRALRQNRTEYQAFRSIVRVFEPISFGRREPTKALFEKTLGGYEAGFATSMENGA
ncbi:DUF4129 domain-containing protein [Thalassoroseus pseudoceratinae]|uniref:DUF4129 domain-containing protein n=1 Tax=Thalassoroseus pseudoceratinae TaxID=2713176 RepID=UPI00142242C6|nr:DUF4129 domain-containing protein [Thalassoroseus pseudoceratinae]